MTQKQIMGNSLSSRFYDRAGQPRYEVKCKTKDGMRRPTIRDAKEHGWCPSVTTVLKMISKPALETWKSMQLVESALTHPRIGDKDIHVDDLVGEIIYDAQQVSREAMNLGTQYHDDIEKIFDHRSVGKKCVVIPEKTESMLRVFKKEMRIKPFFIEAPFAHSEGFGGRVDCVAKMSQGGKESLVVIDWKTQGTKPNRKAAFWEDWSLQLAAYAHGVSEHFSMPELASANLMSVIVSTTEEGRVEYKIWEEPEYRWELFRGVLDLWKSPLGTGADLSFDRDKTGTVLDKEG